MPDVYKAFISSVLILNICDAYKVLVVFPVPGKSHSMLGEGYVRHLLEAGHEVTYVTPIPVKDAPPGLRQVDISYNFKHLSMDIFNAEKLINKEIDLQDYFLLLDVIQNLLHKTYEAETIQKFMNDPKEQFDAVIVEWLFSELSAGFSSVFNCPLIWSSSVPPHTTVLSLIDQHLNPSYTIGFLARRHSFDFWEKVKRLGFLIQFEYYRWLDSDKYNEAFKTIFEPATIRRGRQLPHFDDVKYNGSLMLGNSHVATSDNFALPQNYKHIGGYHLKGGVKPLPKDLQKLMDDSKNGVIYFSLGTMLKSTEIPENIKKGLIETFASLKQTVIWKFEENMSNLPKNVHILQWAPQDSILTHPNCVLFITHGGLLSLMESLTAGKPIIGMPFFGDQFTNVDRAELFGYGKRMDLNEETLKTLRNTIKEMLENPSYRQRAKEHSVIFKTNIVPPGKELVYWVEYVIRTKGAFHLRSPALRVSWYSKYFIDLAIVILVILILVTSLCKRVLAMFKVNGYRKKKMS